MDEEIVFNLTQEEREKILQEIISKVSQNQTRKEDTKTRQTKWKNEEFVREVILEYVKLLTVNRNANIQDIGSIISERTAFNILSQNFNFRNKPNPKKARETFEILDQYMTQEEANQIFKGFPKIVTMSLEEIMSKLEILQKYNYISRVVENPRKLMASSEWIENRLEHYSKMVQAGTEIRSLEEIPASEILSDKTKTAQDRKKRQTKKEEDVKEGR